MKSQMGEFGSVFNPKGGEWIPAAEETGGAFLNNVLCVTKGNLFFFPGYKAFIVERIMKRGCLQRFLTHSFLIVNAVYTFLIGA